MWTETWVTSWTHPEQKTHQLHHNEDNQTGSDSDEDRRVPEQIGADDTWTLFSVLGGSQLISVETTAQCHHVHITWTEPGAITYIMLLLKMKCYRKLAAPDWMNASPELDQHGGSFGNFLFCNSAKCVSEDILRHRNVTPGGAQTDNEFSCHRLTSLPVSPTQRMKSPGEL